MNDKMSVIYIQQTGHVVGAITCNSDPKRSLAPADIASPAFLFTQSPDATTTVVDTEFSIPPSVLAVSPPIDYNDALFKSPATYAISGTVAEQLTVKLTGSLIPKLTSTALEFTLLTAAAADISIWAQVQESKPVTLPPDTRVLSGVLPKGTTGTIDIPLTILPGGAAASIVAGLLYSLVVCVGGYLPDFESQTPS